MTSKMLVSRTFLTTNIHKNYSVAKVAYKFRNKILTGAGATLDFNWFTDDNMGAFATYAVIDSITSSNVTVSGITISLDTANLTINPSMTTVSVPPIGEFTITVRWGRLISTGVYNTFARGADWDIGTSASIVEVESSNTLTLTLENPGTPAISAADSIAFRVGLALNNTNIHYDIWARSAPSTPMTHGDGGWSFSLTGPGQTISRQMYDNSDGTYGMNFVVSASGSYTIDIVTAAGDHCGGFPNNLLVV